MKKLINRAEDVVREMLYGLVAVHPDLALLADHHVLLRADADDIRDQQVTLISGGGSGHEPAHAGYVGAGMLSAAVAGEVFTSPAPEAVLAAIRAVAGKPGVLLIVKNYTGDRLNFGLAAEMARGEGIPVEVVVVADDVALAGTEQYAGARGLAGTVFVHKIAGAAAAEGHTLAQVAAIARETAAATATMGVALSAGIVPAAGKPSFVLADDEVELGLGIHGEPGVRRVALGRADELARQIVETIVSAQNLRAHECIAVLVNNLGATTAMELAIFSAAALKSLETHGLIIERVWAGTFMTSLEAAGVSVSTLRLNPKLIRYLDAATSAPAWRGGALKPPGNVQNRIVNSPTSLPVPRQDSPIQPPNNIQRAIHRACQALLRAEARLTELDRMVGDGDLGGSLARGASRIEELLPVFQLFTAAETLKSIGMTMQSVVGGSSGALYAAFFLRSAASLANSDAQDAKAWARACLEGCNAIADLGDSKPGDRTMLDALQPFATTLLQALEQAASLNGALQQAVEAAERGAQETMNMSPRRGRSSYLGNRVLGHPDPGAVAAAIWLAALREV